jgi:LmbE family N-acetylglucosaminyl deacetylase
MKLLGFDRVLCLSPHPDDVEYSMSGTIMKYKDTQFDMLTLSIGGDFDTTTTNSRHNEVEAAWRSADIKNIKIRTCAHLKPKDCPADKMIHEIETNYLEESHDAIFVPSSIDSHFEHRMTNSIAPALTRVKNVSIIEYKTPSTLHEWSANMLVDISDIFNRKLKILKKFKSQQMKWYFKKELIEHFHADYQSFKKGYRYVEQFKINQLYRL